MLFFVERNYRKNRWTYRIKRRPDLLPECNACRDHPALFLLHKNKTKKRLRTVITYHQRSQQIKNNWNCTRPQRTQRSRNIIFRFVIMILYRRMQTESRKNENIVPKSRLIFDQVVDNQTSKNVRIPLHLFTNTPPIISVRFDEFVSVLGTSRTRCDCFATRISN